MKSGCSGTPEYCSGRSVLWKSPFRHRDLFCCEQGYQIPKLDTRAAVFKGDKILLVRERNGAWSLPGGWVDVNISVRENVILPVYAYKVCKIFVLCSVLGRGFQENPETTESRYFGQNELPRLAEEKKQRTD